MTKHLRNLAAALVLLSLLACGVAEAQNVNPCTGQPTTNPVNLGNYVVGQPTTCVNASARQYEANAHGVMAWRYCLNPATGKHYFQLAVSPWSDFQQAPAMAKDLLAAGLNMDEASIDALARKYMNKPLADPAHAAVWCPVWDRLVTGRPADLPPPAPAPVWVTASTLLYNARNGALSGLAGTTTLNKACDCSKPLVLGTVTYCPLQGATNQDMVARCRKP